MKITLNKVDLLAGLNKLTKVIGGTKIIPVLENVKITAANNQIELIGSNSDLIGLVYLDQAAINSSGSALLNFKDLSSFVKKAKGEKVTIENSNSETFVTIGKVNLKVEKMDPADYPKMPQTEFKEMVFTNEEFKRAIENTGYAVGKSETRPILTAINIKAENEQIKFVATDSHRLGEYKINVPDQLENLQATPSGDGLKLGLKLLEKNNKNVTMKFSNMYTVLAFDNMQLYIKNVQGNYPDTDRLMPDQFKTELELNKTELLELSPQLAIFGKETVNNAICLNFEDQAAAVSNAQNKKGVISSGIEIKKASGEDVKLLFNLNYFEDVLKIIGGDVLKMKLNGHLKPFIVQGMDQAARHLILPVRTF